MKSLSQQWAELSTFKAGLLVFLLTFGALGLVTLPFREDTSGQAERAAALQRLQTARTQQQAEPLVFPTPPGVRDIIAGKWIESESRSRLDDSRTVVLQLEAEADISGWLRDARPTLIIRCQENETDLYVKTVLPPNPEIGDGITVRVRLDSEPAAVQEWGEATSDDALFSPAPIPLAKRLVEASTMLFQFTPFNSPPVVAEFSIAGLQYVLPDVAAACNWSL